MRGLAVTIGALLVASAVAACGSLLATDDIPPLAGDASPPPAAPPPAPASPEDAGTTDAEAGVDSGPPTFCEARPGHTFCWDFDTSSALEPTFSLPKSGAASIVVNGALAHSAPSSADVTTPGGASTSTGSITKSLAVPVTASRVRWRFSAYLARAEGAYPPCEPHVFSVTTSSAAGSSIMFVGLVPPQSTYLNEWSPAGGIESSALAGTALPQKGWRQVEIVVDWAAKRASFSVDGVAGAQKVLALRYGRPMTIGLGFGNDSPDACSGASELRMDDVLVDFED